MRLRRRQAFPRARFWEPRSLHPLHGSGRRSPGVLGDQPGDNAKNQEKIQKELRGTPKHTGVVQGIDLSRIGNSPSCLNFKRQRKPERRASPALRLGSAYADLTSMFVHDSPAQPKA